MSGFLRKAYWLAAGRVQDHGPADAGVREVTQEHLGLYCLDFRPALESGHFDAFDDDGIPMRVLPDGRRHYSPTRVAGYAVACFQQLGETGEDARRDRFLRQADWFVAAAQAHEAGGVVWRYDFPHQHLPPGWISGMAQGQAISVLCRAFLLTDRQEYLDVASRASVVFGVPVDRGGVASRFPQTGEVCYEEMPLARPSRILNGWIYGLWGLCDLGIAAKDAEADRMYREGLASLLAHLDEYDTGWWSYYDLPDGSPPRLASFHYHVVDVRLLHALAERTGEKAFAQRAERWDDYARSLRRRLRALSGKLVQRIRYGY